MDHKISALPGGAPLKDTHSDWLPDVALRVDVMMLEQVEALEDKVANASMQVKVSASASALTLVTTNLNEISTGVMSVSWSM
jgi:hypothetical protein